MALLLDTGILYAAADRRDAWHARARAVLEREKEVLLVPVTVLPEVCYLLHERLGVRSERSFLAALGSDLVVEPFTASDLEACRTLLDRRPELGFVDASIVVIAGRLGIRRLATTDRRHFDPVARESMLELVP